MKTRKHPNQPDQAREGAPAPADNSEAPALEGEGNYTAARRHRQSVETFIDTGIVEQAAEDAAPRDEEDAQDMREAEVKGRSRAKK